MPVKMTELTPQIPSGAAKISAEVGNIVAEDSFDAELELVEAIPAESIPESQSFTAVGQIVRKMVPLGLPIQRAAVQPPSIDVELPAEKTVAAEAAHDQTRQVFVVESKMPAKIAPIEETEDGPQLRNVIPSVQASSAQMPSSLPIASFPNKPSDQVMPFATKPQIGRAHV